MPGIDALPRYAVRRALRAPDGAIDWSGATLLDRFIFPWEPTPPPQTHFRALWDDERLRFRFDCVDHDIVIGAGDDPKIRVLDSDRVELFFTADLSMRPYYVMEINPAGDVLDYAAMHYREFDRAWDFPGLEVEAAIEKPGFAVRGSIPLATLRHLNVLKPGHDWFYAGVFRGEFSHNPDGSIRPGWMTWIDPHTEKPDFHVPASFGVFELVGGA